MAYSLDAARSGSDKATEWQARLNRFTSADQTISAFCVAESVSEACFYKWRTKLQATKVRQPAASRPRPARFIDAGLTPLSSAKRASEVENFHRTTDPANGSVELRIDLGGGLVLQIARH